MLERDIEAHLVKRCKAEDILCDKFTSPQRRSVPDRILTARDVVLFLELKATGARPTDAQKRDHRRRREHGAMVYWTDSIEGVEAIVAFMEGRCTFKCDGDFKVIA
jgi:hypothetical protein